MSASSQSLLVIEAGQAEKEYWTELWRKRELLYFLAWRDTLVKYKQTMIGILWVLLKPIFTLAIFTLVFGKIAALPSSNAPYSVLVFSGLLPWLFFATTVSEVSNGVHTNAGLVGKVYFPRLIIPLASLCVGLVDYAVSCLLLIVITLVTGTPLTSKMLLLPLLTVWVAALSLGVGLIGAALNVRYRDFRHLIPFALQLGVYVSPVGYSAGLISERWRFVYSLNPMVGIIDGFRWCVLGLGSNSIYVPGVLASIALTVVLLIGGIHFFRRVEKRFVDFL